MGSVLIVPVSPGVPKTEAVEVFEDVVHAHNFIIKLVVTGGTGEEGISVSDEKVKNVHHLKQKVSL